MKPKKDTNSKVEHQCAYKYHGYCVQLKKDTNSTKIELKNVILYIYTKTNLFLY